MFSRSIFSGSRLFCRLKTSHLLHLLPNILLSIVTVVFRCLFEYSLLFLLYFLPLLCPFLLFLLFFIPFIMIPVFISSLERIVRFVSLFEHFILIIIIIMSDNANNNAAAAGGDGKKCVLISNRSWWRGCGSRE